MIIPATKMENSFGDFTLKVYLDCAKNQAKLTKPGDKNIKFTYVAEEEEDVI